MNMKELKYTQITVRSNGISDKLFNQLCDVLKENHPLSDDYRMVSDFDRSKERPYWHSNIYSINSLLPNFVMKWVQEEVKLFCVNNNTNLDEIEIATLEF